MKKYSEAFKQAKRANLILTHASDSLSVIKDVFIALALACALSIYFLSVPANAYNLDPTLSLSYSGGTIRARYFQDPTIDFADDLSQRAIKNLFNGTPRTINAQTLIFVEDNAVMNYHLDEPLEIITLAQIITQQIENALDYQPDLLTFIIFDASLAIVYQSNLWVSDNYFHEAIKAIDRAEAIRQEERTNEQMRPDRDDEQYYYDENNVKQYFYGPGPERSSYEITSHENGQINIDYPHW